MLRRFLPLVVLLAACATKAPDAAPPEWIIGKYHYAGNGVAAKKFPWEAKSDLILDRDGQYTLSIMVHIDDKKGGDSDTHESYGSYYVDGTKLVLQPVNHEDSDDTEEFEIRGKQLVPRMNWTAKLAMRGFSVPSPVFVKTD